MRERIAIVDFLSPKTWFAQIKYYLFMGEHPHLKGVYNPLQFIAYIGLYAMVFIVCITGLVLYVHVYHEGLGGALYDYMRPLEVMMGGLANVREIHHIAMWGILIFVPVHIYMAIFNSIMGKEGSIDSIISGYKFEKQDH
jgi:Ni/Fe-hydrogenase 1 B-type cytochrome subunit